MSAVISVVRRRSGRRGSVWQWTAGCGADAAPFFRIFNPALQAERYDPEGTYVHRWVPDLVADRGGRSDYPAPIVDFRESRGAALAAYAAIKR